MDIARRRPFRAGVAATDAALRMNLCSRELLRAVIEDCRRWVGLRQARTVAAFADARAVSPLESISRVEFHDYGLPPPILQAVIGGYEEADFRWPAYRVIGEADGMSKYTSVEVLRREKVRQENLTLLGLECPTYHDTRSPPAQPRPERCHLSGLRAGQNSSSVDFNIR